jgi:hypothetical protein
MKKPKRKPNFPEGVIPVGGPLEWFSVALIVYTEEIPIEQLSKLLGSEPSTSQRKGIRGFRADGTPKRFVPKCTMWELRLLPSETDEWDLCEAAKLLLGQVTADLNVWREISSHSDIKLSFGLSMDGSNRGFSLDQDLIRNLSDRNIRAEFDVYTDDFENEIKPASSTSGTSKH